MGEQGRTVSAQDYYPYGEYVRSYNTGTDINDKYMFTRKERDIESLYDYFGARYYYSQLGIWHSVDPMNSKYPGWSGYNYALCDPLSLIDIEGLIPCPILAFYNGFTRYNSNSYGQLVTSSSTASLSSPLIITPVIL